jgi:hypothetical protein
MASSITVPPSTQAWNTAPIGSVVAADPGACIYPSKLSLIAHRSIGFLKKQRTVFTCHIILILGTWPSMCCECGPTFGFYRPRMAVSNCEIDSLQPPAYQRSSRLAEAGSRGAGACDHEGADRARGTIMGCCGRGVVLRRLVLGRGGRIGVRPARRHMEPRILADSRIGYVLY